MLYAFIDTNVSLHYPPLAHIDWCKVCGVDEVTLMFSLASIDELDDKKSDPVFAEKARQRIKEIDASEGKGEIRQGVRIEVYAASIRSRDFAATLDPERGDERIVQYAIAFRDRESKTIAIITEDKGMKIRCMAHGIDTFTPPFNQRLADPQSEDKKEIQRLKKEIADVTNRLPKLEVTANAIGKLSRPTLHDVDGALTKIKKEMERYSPQTNYEDHRFVRFFQDTKAWIELQNRILDESARTVTINFKIANVGRAPANRINVEIQFPESFVAFWASYQSVGTRSNHGNIPVSPYRYPDLKKFVPVAPMKPEQWGSGGGGYPGMPVFSGNALTVSVHELRHDDFREVNNVMVTFGSWEDVHTFELMTKVYVHEPPDTVINKLPVFIEME
jgi:hypothetical protein